MCSACAHLEPVVSRLCSAKSHKRHTCFLHLSAEHRSILLPSGLSAAPCAACAFERSRESPLPAPILLPASKSTSEKEKPPGLRPTVRLQKHFGKKKNLPAFILLSARKSAAKERKSLRLSPYCPPAKAQRKKEKPPGLRPTSRQQKHFGKRKASRPLSYFLPEKALRKKKSLPAFILLIACKNVKRKQVRDLCDFAEPSLETIGSRRRRRSTNAYLFS